MAGKKVIPPVAETTEEQQATLIVGFDAETKQLIRALTEALANRPAPIINLAAAQPISTAPSALKVTANVPAPKVTAKASAPAPTNDEPEETVSLTQIREAINAKVSEGKTTAIVALLHKCGAKNASTLAEEYYNSFFTELQTL